MDELGAAVNRALFAEDCRRLSEWALIGPVQRAAVESFAERLLAAERERCARLCEDLERSIWDEYKAGYRSSSYTEGRSDGAGECAVAIRRS